MGNSQQKESIVDDEEQKSLIESNKREEEKALAQNSKNAEIQPVPISNDFNSAPPGVSRVNRERMKYYNRLAQRPEMRFNLPPGYLPPELFIRPVRTTEVDLPSVMKPSTMDIQEGVTPVKIEPARKQSSMVTIFSIANTMLGSSMVALPWAFTQSGLATGLGVVLLVGMICFYTAYLIVKNARGYDDFSVICSEILAEYVTVLSSVLVLIGAATAYDIIMSNSLFDFVTGIREHAAGHQIDHPEGTYWNSKTAPALLILLLLPLINLKEFRVLIKFNTVGVASVLYLVIYIPFVSFYKREISFPKTEEFDHKFFYLFGVLTLAFFIHNCVLSILKTNKNQDNNARDLMLAYMIVAGCYAIVGGSAYLSFGNSVEIPQDFLKLMDESNIPAMIGRAFLIIQLFSVYPIILFIIRIQFFGLFWQNPYPGFWHVLGLNVIVATITTLFAIFFPQIGVVLRFTGAIVGLIYVFLLPIAVHWMIQKKNNELTITSIIFHGALVLVGIGSLISQFF